MIDSQTLSKINPFEKMVFDVAKKYYIEIMMLPSGIIVMDLSQKNSKIFVDELRNINDQFSFFNDYAGGITPAYFEVIGFGQFTN